MNLRTIFEAWLFASSGLEHAWPSWRLLHAHLTSTLHFQLSALLRRDDYTFEDLNLILQEHDYAGVNIETWTQSIEVFGHILVGRKYWRL